MRTAEEIRAQISALEAELQKQEEAETRAAQSGNAKQAIALLSAMRTAFKEVQLLFPDTFDPDKWSVAFNGQTWPRSSKFRRMADLSETEVRNAQEVGAKAIEDLK